MPLPGFGTQRFGVSAFGRGARNITVRFGPGRSRTLTVTVRAG